MQSDKVVQIVITRNGPDEFKVTTFSKKECLDGLSLDAKSASEFISKTMKQLKALPGIGD